MRSKKMAEEYYIVKEVSKTVRRHPRTVRRWIDEGFIQAIRVKNRWLIPKTEVERILIKNSSSQNTDIVT